MYGTANAVGARSLHVYGRCWSTNRWGLTSDSRFRTADRWRSSMLTSKYRYGPT